MDIHIFWNWNFDIPWNWDVGISGWYVASLVVASESFKFFLLKKCVIVVDLPIIYKSNRNYIYFVHYIINIYYIIIKQNNFDTHN
jgi:hypothetical protein